MIEIRRFHESVQIGRWDEVFGARDHQAPAPVDGHRGEFGPWEQVELRSGEDAVYCLRRLGITDDEFPQLRSLLADEGLSLTRTDRHHLIDQIGHRLAMGLLVLWVRAAHPKKVSMPAARVQPAPPLPPLPPPRRPTPSPPPPMPANDGTFSAESDLAAQLATLSMAAQSGVPFGELCEKARQEREEEAGAPAP